MRKRGLRAGDLIIDDTGCWSVMPCLVTNIHVFQRILSTDSHRCVCTFAFLRNDGRRERQHVYLSNGDTQDSSWPQGCTGLARDGTRFLISFGT